jgi:hypothetical protein
VTSGRIFIISRLATRESVEGSQVPNWGCRYAVWACMPPRFNAAAGAALHPAESEILYSPSRGLGWGRSLSWSRDIAPPSSRNNRKRLAFGALFLIVAFHEDTFAQRGGSPPLPTSKALAGSLKCHSGQYLVTLPPSPTTVA